MVKRSQETNQSFAFLYLFLTACQMTDWILIFPLFTWLRDIRLINIDPELLPLLLSKTGN